MRVALPSPDLTERAKAAIRKGSKAGYLPYDSDYYADRVMHEIEAIETAIEKGQKNRLTT